MAEKPVLTGLQRVTLIVQWPIIVAEILVLALVIYAAIVRWSLLSGMIVVFLFVAVVALIALWTLLYILGWYFTPKGRRISGNQFVFRLVWLPGLFSLLLATNLFEKAAWELSRPAMDRWAMAEMAAPPPAAGWGPIAHPARIGIYPIYSAIRWPGYVELIYGSDDFSDSYGFVYAPGGMPGPDPSHPSTTYVHLDGPWYGVTEVYDH